MVPPSLSHGYVLVAYKVLLYIFRLGLSQTRFILPDKEQHSNLIFYAWHIYTRSLMQPLAVVFPLRFLITSLSTSMKTQPLQPEDL